jgi:hypothetical protein
MNQAFLSGLRILALDPASRGLGYVAMEGLTLIDWGFYNVRENKDAQRIAFVGTLLAHYQPDVLVLEEYVGKQRSLHIERLADAFAKLADSLGTQIYRVPREAVRASFATKNKYDIAAALAARFPELTPWCPPHRKVWQSENPHINTFDALARAWASIDVWTRNEEEQGKAADV